LSPGAAQLLSACGQGGDEVTLFAAAGLERSFGRRLIRELAGSGHLLAAVHGWRPAPGLVDPYDELVAIEAKLEDWRRAEAQAARYRTYADASYVVLPVERITPTVREFFARGPVGLLGAGDHVEMVVQARVSSPLEPWRRLLVAEVLTARLSNPGTHRATLGTSASRYPRSGQVPSVQAQPSLG